MEDETATPNFDDSVATTLVQSIVRQIEGALHASVAVLSGDHARVILSTDQTMDAVGDACDSPSAAVIRTGHIVRVPTVERNTEFPEFIAKCRRLGICSMAGFPIKDAALRTVGVLTVTSADHHGFGTSDLLAARRTAELLAGELCQRAAPMTFHPSVAG